MKFNQKSNSANKVIRRISHVVFAVVLLSVIAMNQSCKEKGVKLVVNEADSMVDVMIDGSLFTSYRYSPDVEKPFLYPVIAPNGSVITRGFPLEPRKGERVDHPHHVGIWFNHGEVNGLDFWNNSSAIPAEKKADYGYIVHQKIEKAESGEKGELKVVMNWQDVNGNVILAEQTTYIFSGDKNSRTVDHLSTLTAVADTVHIGESKEGLFAIRVDRAFEMPSDESLIFTDDKGNPTTVKATDNTGVTGMYSSSSGKKGHDVWGTRNDWVVLTGVKDDVTISFGIFDNPANPGYPAYAHARGYGLFSVNNLGQNSYDPGVGKVTYTLLKGESLTLRHRFYVQSGSEVTTEQANKLFQDFSEIY